jgi:copper(I)-binding protein
MPALGIEDAWVRALPPTQKTTAAYLTVTNRGDAAIDIVGASTGIAAEVEIHKTREVEGYTRMERLDGLSLAPGESLSLAPGGTHLMLLGLERMPLPGESVELCLQPAAGSPVCTDAAVRRSESDAPAHDHHHHHPQ